MTASNPSPLVDTVGEPTSGEGAATEHCFREDGCALHDAPVDNTCCCCGGAPEAHAGCDCE